MTAVLSQNMVLGPVAVHRLKVGKQWNRRPSVLHKNIIHKNEVP